MYSTEQPKDRLFWLRWLEKYKILRCLWDVDIKEYTNRIKRKEAYTELVDMAKSIHPEADEAFVKARINCFRTAYRKEAKKVLAARENGSSYEPTWFYYNQLNSVFQLDNNLDEIFANQAPETSDTSDGEDPFATVEIKPSLVQTEDIYRNRNQKKSRDSISNIHTDSSHDFDDNSFTSFERRASHPSKAIRSVKRKFPSLKTMAENFNTIESNEEENCNKQISTKESVELYNNEPSQKKHVRTSPAGDDTYIETEYTPKNNQNLEDECDIIGKRIASHFKNMKQLQRLIAERIICDVCIHGRMDQLTWESSFSAAESSKPNRFQQNGLSNSAQKIYEEEVIIDPEDYAHI